MSNILLMPFLDKSETYVLGFELGSLWERIQAGECFNSQPVHTKNTDQIKLMCEKFNLIYEIKELEDGWSYFTVNQTMI